jgi:hypothetical protein
MATKVLPAKLNISNISFPKLASYRLTFTKFFQCLRSSSAFKVQAGVSGRQRTLKLSSLFWSYAPPSSSACFSPDNILKCLKAEFFHSQNATQSREEFFQYSEILKNNSRMFGRKFPLSLKSARPNDPVALWQCRFI